MRTFIESLYPKVNKVDSHENIEMFCYDYCDNSTPKDIASVRGVVLHNDSVIFKGFGYIPEYTVHDLDHVKLAYPDVSNYVFYESIEGTLLRVFYALDRWHISTHKKLNAYKSKWGSNVSFGEQFEKCLPDSVTAFLETLDKTNQYLFVVHSTCENRIVCKTPSTPYMLHVGTFVKGVFTANIDVGIARPQMIKFNTYEDVFCHVEHLNHLKKQGLIMYTGTEQVKLLNTRYKKLMKIRNNEPNLTFRYFQLRNDPELKQQFVTLFPERQNEINLVEKKLLQISVEIYKTYVKRYVYKEYIPTTPTKHYLLKQCHAWHTVDRKNNIISLNKVSQIMNELPTHTIYKLYTE